MARTTAQEYVDKLIRNAKNAVRDYTAGIDRVRQSPTAAAAEQLDLLLERLREKIESGEMAASLNAVSLQDWQRSAREKGSTRYAPGIEAARNKVASFAQEFLPYLDSVSERVRAMPKTTLEDRIARMTEQVRRTAEFRRTRR